MRSGSWRAGTARGGSGCTASARSRSTIPGGRHLDSLRRSWRPTSPSKGRRHTSYKRSRRLCLGRSLEHKPYTVLCLYATTCQARKELCTQMRSWPSLPASSCWRGRGRTTERPLYPSTCPRDKAGMSSCCGRKCPPGSSRRVARWRPVLLGRQN